MPAIGDYFHLTGVFLQEAGKYFALLLFAVLATRLWRRALKMPRGRAGKDCLLAAIISALAFCIGYFSICHSMSRMYSYFGKTALYSYRLEPALTLFQTSYGYWKNADALGGEGLSLLWLGHEREGLSLLEKARAMRNGKASSFLNFYQGSYFFYHDDVTNAVPLLEQASTDPAYSWDVIKIFSTMELDRDQPAEAARLMQPYLQAVVTDFDQAYIVASLKLSEGKTNEALVLTDEFLTNSPPPFWETRLEKLRAKIQGKNP
jgi:hypothetical protein